MSKDNLEIKKIKKEECCALLSKHHYLTNISRGFKSGINYGLFDGSELIGVCIFTGFPVPELAKGMFDLERDNQDGLFELSRLCLLPDYQKSEHNLASWFLSRCLKLLKKEFPVKCVLTYADSAYHNGTVYAACNFVYYGLTSPRKDFFYKNKDGTFTKHSRGPTKGVEWKS